MKDCQLCDGCKFEKNTQLNKVYYEIHITVKYSKRFIGYCLSNDIKVVDIFMGDDIPNHLMTSISKSFCTDHECNEYISKLTQNIVSNGFIIERIKVEVSPNHNKAIKNTTESYFESHFAITNPDEWLDSLRDLHKSKNLLKKSDKTVQMLTYRKRCSLSEFNDDVKNIEIRLKSYMYNIDKVIVEYCLFDSMESLDNEWFKK